MAARAAVSPRGAVIASLLVAAALIAGLAWNHRTETPANPAREDTVRLLKSLAGAYFVGYVRKDGAELHASPDASSPVLRREAKGAQIEARENKGVWQNVRDGDLEGWMRAEDLSYDRP